MSMQNKIQCLHPREYYNQDSSRFWSACTGLVGRDVDIYPLLNGCKGNLLEYGCGSGSLICGLAHEKRFVSLTGVDISNKAIQKIKNSWRQNSPKSIRNKLKLIQSSGNIKSLKSKSFDILISVATIEHVFNPFIILEELHRLGKTNSTLICSVPNYAYIKHRLALLIGNQPKTGTDSPVENWKIEGHWDGMHLHTFTKKSFTILLNSCGWKTVQWLGCGEKYNWLGLGFLRRRFPGFWSGELIAKCKKQN